MSNYVRRLLFIFALVLTVGLFGASSTEAAGSAPYIIVFHDNVDVAATVPDVAQAHGLQTGFVYQNALKGMSAQVPLGRLNGLENDPRVAYIVPDQLYTLEAQTIPTGIARVFADEVVGKGHDAVDE